MSKEKREKLFEAIVFIKYTKEGIIDMTMEELAFMINGNVPDWIKFKLNAVTGQFNIIIDLDK